MSEGGYRSKMAVTDSTLAQLLTSPSQAVRTAALELLSNGYSELPVILTKVFATWDAMGVHEGYPEFPLLSHVSVAESQVHECIQRAERMASGKPLVDRGCRCAGKLIEAISVGSPIRFANHLHSIRQLKSQSKIFFRVDIHEMGKRIELMDQSTDVLLSHAESHDPTQSFDSLECLWNRNDAGDWIYQRLDSLSRGKPISVQHTNALKLGTRYGLIGQESALVALLSHENSQVADTATIGLARCRSLASMSEIANRFPRMSRLGQLRAIDVIARSRQSKSAELLRFIRRDAIDQHVHEALLVAEVLQFDVSSLEDWLESLVVMKDESIERMKGLLMLSLPLFKASVETEYPRVESLLRSRLGYAIDREPL